MDPHRPRRDLRLAKLAAALAALGAAASGIELIALGQLTPPVLALDSIAASLAPLAVIAMFVEPGPPHHHPRPRDDDQDDHGDGGGGGGGGGERPRGPSGGLDIDWGRFEREFQSYAQRAAQTLTPTRA